MRLSTVAFLVCVCVALPHAQTATGTIEGRVVDASGAVLADVVISLRQPSTGLERTTATDGRGLFRAPLLPVGAYELTATRQGFEPWRSGDLQLTVGQTMSLELVLSLAGIAQAVEVTAERPLLERSRTQVSATVDRVAIQHLPVNGRNFLDFALLTSGVTRDVRAGDLSFLGQRGPLNSLIVDGADNNNTFAGQALGRAGSGRAPYQFSIDAVQEFQVNASGYSAEYGRAAGGIINAVTRSGSNRLHGSLFEFYRDKALNATSAINRRDRLPKSPYHYHQFGGTAGGPLRRDRDFFFVNYDGQRNTQPNDVSLGLPETLPTDEATRNAIARLSALARSWTRSLDQDVFLLKTDHHVGSASRITVRYNHQDFTGVNFENSGPQLAVEHTGDSLVNTRTLNATWFHPIGRVYNELRVQYAQDDSEGTANSDDPETIIQEGSRRVLTIGRNPFSPRYTRIDRLQFSDTATWLHGRHAWKAGADLQLDRIDTFFPNLFAGQYVFLSLASFDRRQPEVYRQSFAGPGTTGPYSRPDVQEFSAFVQDEWKPAPALTVNLGVRYDVMRLAAPRVRNDHAELLAAGIDTSRLDADLDNIAPRVGLVWSPGQRLALRGGWGVFYGRSPAITGNAAHFFNGVNIVSLTFTGTAVPTYPARFSELSAAGSAGRPNVFYVEPGFDNPRTTQAHAAVERQLTQNTSLTLTYLFADGSDLPQARDRNVGTAGLRTFTVEGSSETVTYPFFGNDRPFSDFARVIAVTSAAESRYHGLTIDAHRRFAGDFMVRGAYTLSKVTDTVPNAFPTEDTGFASDPVDVEVDRAPGANDQRHRFVASGVYSTDGAARRLTGMSRRLLGGWWVSGVLSAQSGQPYSARVTGPDLNNDGNLLNDLAPGTRRNAFRMPASLTLDTRLARVIRVADRVDVQVIWEAFNVLNRTNMTAVERGLYTLDQRTLTLTRNANFARPLAAADPRIMQLAARLTF